MDCLLFIDASLDATATDNERAHHVAKLLQGTGGPTPAPSWLVFARVLASQISAQFLFGVEDHHPDRRKPPFQCPRDLGVTHLLVVAQHERHFVFFGQANQLFPYFEPFFPAQNLGERRSSRIVGDLAKVSSVHARTLLTFSSSQLINAMPACHLRHPREEWHRLIS